MGFCVYCGKELEEGATCDCEGARKADDQKADFSEGLSNVASAGTEAVGKAKVALFKIVKAPVTEGVAYVDGTNSITSAAMVIVQAVISGLFAMILALKYNGAIKGLGGGWLNLSSLKVSSIKALFMTLLFSLVISAFFAGIFFLVGKIAKLEISFYTAIDLAGVRSSLLCASSAIATVLTIIFPAVGASIFYICGFLFSIVIGCVLLKKYEGSDNKIAYATVVGMLVFFLISAFFMSQVYKVYIPKNFMDSLLGASNWLSLL